MSLRILIDLQGAQNGSRNRGIGRYSLAITRAIARNASEHRVYVLLNGLFPESIPEIRAAFRGLLDDSRFVIFTPHGPVSELEGSNAWRRRTAEIVREHFIDSLTPDVILITSMVEGAVDDTVSSFGSLHTSALTAAIVYDLIPLKDEARYIGWEPAKLWYHGKVASLRRAELLLSISDATREDCIRILGTEPSHIVNISSAADEAFSSGKVSQAFQAQVTQRLGIVKKFLMHSSAYEERKNFEGLIRAFAALPNTIRRNYQLVLVSKLDQTRRDTLIKLGTASGLKGNDLVLTGFIPDDELIALYTSCHLFVFPSFEEGFGLPALEAMSCGAPTIGSRSTSVPEVVGRRDALFDPHSDEEISSLILKVLTEPAFYQSLRQHAKTQAARFSWDDVAIRTINAMQDLRAARPTHFRTAITDIEKRSALIESIAEIASDDLPDDLDIHYLATSLDSTERAARNVMASATFEVPLKWRIEGPFDSTYSLALLNRETARALSLLGHTVVLHSTEGPGDFPANEAFLAMNTDIRTMHARDSDYPPNLVDVVSRNLFPPRVKDLCGRLNLLHHYAWEESGFPSDWVNDFNTYLDGITCLSTHVQKILIDNGLHIPMSTSGCGVDHWERIAPNPAFNAPGRSFRFLHVSSCFPRKGVEALLAAYGQAFSDADDVTLIIKTFINPHNQIRDLLSKHRLLPHYPDVEIIEDNLTDADLKALYEQCHALVAPSRAEGFGLPMAEAMLSGLPVITTAWSGQLDFCNPHTAWLVDYEFQQAETHFDLNDSVWAAIDVGALADTMAIVRKTSAAERKLKAQTGRKLLLDNFTWRDVTARLVETAKSLQRTSGQLRSEPKIGWITTWNTKCGIAAYSEKLIGCFPTSVTVLAPDTDESLRSDGHHCYRIWSASKDHNNLSQLQMKVAELGLDTLILQFNYGFYNFLELSSFLNDQVDAGRVVIVMLHATGDPGLEPSWNWSLKPLAPAFARCSRLLVHSIDDLNRLKKLGLVENVCLFPHGIQDWHFTASPSTRESKSGSPPLIATYGFCLPHKGLVELLTAAKLMRDDGSPVRLRFVNAEYPIPVSTELVQRISKLTKEFGLDSLVEQHHDYLPDGESLALLGEADLIVYPYQQTNESASGAIRLGLASGRPIAVTPIPIFNELVNCVHRLPGLTPGELAVGIRQVLANVRQHKQSAIDVARRAERWRVSHGYPGLANKLHNICRGLARTASRYERVFDGSSRRFRTEVGRLSGKAIVTSGVAGYLVYGLCLGLSIGRYRILLQGSYEIVPGASASCEVCTAGGSEILAKIELDHGTDSIVGDFEFDINSRCNDLEIRVLVNGIAQVRLEKVLIQSSVASSFVTHSVELSSHQV